ncbi:MAG: hypothetical protein JRN08_05840 [Nitrososphaerota archaeon]|nr:hypothetical protein [Nitrososphaerota archaeon]
MRTESRRGVASIIGTVFFVVVFMLAMGSLAYASGMQAQASQAAQQAQSAVAMRGAESLAFSPGPGLPAANDGPATVEVAFVVLRFPNGTVYPLPASGAIPSGGTFPVAQLVPSGVCAPGTATCISKFDQIVSGRPPGSSVGVVTTLGNAFWYTYSSPQPQGGTYLSSWVASPVVTSGRGVYTSTTLAVTLAANTTYEFYAFTAIEPSFGTESYDFEVHPLPPGASLIIACSPMSYPEGGGNQPTNCVTTAGTPVAVPGTLAFGVLPPVFQTPGMFGMVRTAGAGGTLEIDFACVGNCGGVSIRAGSYMVVLPVG